MLKLDKVTVRYGESTIVDHLSLQLKEGEWLMLAGPNGAGQSTLIEAIAQGVPYTGNISLNGRDVRTYKSNQLARRIGVLSQKNSIAYAYTVEEIVSLGRYAHTSGLFASRDRDGRKHIEKALKLTGLTHLRHANMLTLSGGELQRAFLAQVFAQNPQILILDEPANHLDLMYQKQVFSLIQEWLVQPGRAVLSVVHDLSLALKYGTHAVLMHEGCSAAQGEIRDVLSREHLQRVYGMDVQGWMRGLLEQWL